MHYSNCLLAALSARVHNPAQTRIHFMRIRRIHLHWFWETDGKFYHFTTPHTAFHKANGETAYRQVQMGFWRTLWFKGEVRHFPEPVLKRLRGLGRLPEIPVTAREMTTCETTPSSRTGSGNPFKT